METTNSAPREQRSASPPRPGHRKRGRYIGNACSACQKRKVKCSGEQPCKQCRSAKTDCAYGHDGRKRKSEASAASKRRCPPTNATIVRGGEHIDVSSNAIAITPTSPSAELQDSSTLIMHVLARLQDLECRLFPNNANTGELQPANIIPFQCDDARAILPANEDVNAVPHYDTSCLFKPVSVLNQRLGGDNASHSSSTISRTWHDQETRRIQWGFDLLEQDMLCCDHRELRDAVNAFFESLNPHYPCLCENEFRPRLEAFLSHDPSYPWEDSGKYHFLALLNLLVAQLKALQDVSTISSTPPGWDQFCHAENILYRLSWLGTGNIRTIECLIMKARYLLYIEKGPDAYDTIGRGSRLCVQLGLHNQDSWTRCSPFEVVMRQRIFWTVFYLERHIALNNGSPYQLRDSDIKVDLPANYDDELMFPDQPLPPPTCVTSHCAFLSASVRWGRLAAELWDEILSVRARKQGSEEFVAIMDARIHFTIEQLPPHLQWDHVDNENLLNFGYPVATVRKALILHLRMNQLRLLLRQEQMLSLKYDFEAAADCLAIATNSIEAMQVHRTSSVQTGLGRFATVLYLLSAILPLVCIIVKPDNQPEIRNVAIEVFKLGLAHIEELSSTYRVAYHSLLRIQDVIIVAKTFMETTPLANDMQTMEPDVPSLNITFADFFSNHNEMSENGAKDEPRRIIHNILAHVSSCDRGADTAGSDWTLL